MARQSFSTTVLRTAVAAALAASCPVRAQIALTCAKTCVQPGERCLFTAAHPDGEPGTWVWTVLEPDGGTLVPGPGGTAEYTAPKGAAPRVVHVQVWEDVHPPRVAIQEVQVRPGGTTRASEAAPWMVPKLEIYAGAPDPAPGDRNARFSGIRKIAYLDDPSLPGHLNHHWVVADGYGLQLVSTRGEIKPWLGGRERPANGHEPPPELADPDAFLCPGLAVRPEGSLESNPFHLVFCEVSPPPHYACRVYALDAGGRRLLAGGTEAGYQDGPAAEALFGQLGDLALDREGNVFLLDRGNLLLRKLGLDGKVTTLAGHRFPGAGEALDGHGTAAGFVDPRGLALDPATGDLYVSDANVIRKVTPAGDVTTLPGLAELSGARGLDHPEGLALQGRSLFIADRGHCAVRVLDLETGALRTVAGDPAETRTRRGPLALYSPGRAPEDCAALAMPHCITFNAEGACLVGTAECLAALDLPPAPERPVHRDAPEEKKDEGKTQAPQGLPAAGPRPILEPPPLAVQALQAVQVPPPLPETTRAPAPASQGSH